MDDYPPGCLDHSVPFLLTLGTCTDTPYDAKLSHALKEQAILIRSELPALDSDQARALMRYMQDRDASNSPCNARNETTRKYRFHIKSAERSLLLPPRRARLPDGFEPPSPTSATVLHSPYSPLSPVSPLYPDGLINTDWIRKHQDLIPSILLCFYTLVSDPTLSTLCDNQIKTDVNNIRALLSQSGYKTKLAVVLLSDGTNPASMEGVQERLDVIRRGCNLDAKALFLVPPNESQEELERVAENMLTTLYAVSLEYYRDLGRHARKKRSRGIAPQPTVPPTSGTSQTLSLAGWNVRYDFKTATFAEYRLEMDVALRSYELAYEALLSTEVMELIPSWSPRWNEARLLADIIAIRCIRCLLWNGQHSAASRRWQFHRERIADFVDRRGRGTNNYGWAAWEARWAAVMADLIDKADIPELAPSSGRLYLPPEKSVMGERLQPWELLHHQGYWHRMAARHTQTRRALARTIPESDRQPPSASPASLVAKSAFTYDTYMCPDPYEEYPIDGIGGGVEHGKLIVDRLIRARSEFLKRGQKRLAAEVSLECARELGMAERWEDVIKLLRPLWQDMPFRTEGWIPIIEEMDWLLRRAAYEEDEAELLLMIDWELHSQSFSKRPNWEYNLAKSLEDIETAEKPDIYIRHGQLISPVAASFLFRDEEGKAGQSVHCQLTIRSNAHQGSALLQLSSVQVNFSGGIGTVVLQHEDVDDTRQKHGNIVLSSLTLTTRESGEDDVKSTSAGSDGEKSAVLKGTADLRLPPGQVLVFNLEIPLREPGDAHAESVVVTIDNDEFKLNQSISFAENSSRNLWYISASAVKHIAHQRPLSLHVLPRPPKMEVRSLGWKEQYYTDEPISLEFEIENGEDVEALSKLDVTLFGEKPSSFTVDLPSGESQTSSSIRSEESRLSGAQLGAIASAKSLTIRLHLPPIESSSRHDLTLKVTYFLPTNPGTPISQTAVFQLNIVNPFEASYDLLPRVHPDPWPSVFDPDTVAPLPGPNSPDTPSFIPKGLSQAWCLVTRYASFASEPLRVTEVSVQISPSPLFRCTAVATKHSLPEDGSGRLIQPKTIEQAAFELTAQRATLDERGPAPLDMALTIRWTRAEGGNLEKVNTTTLPIPRFNIFGTEPRVLATVSYRRRGNTKDEGSGGHLVIVLTVTIENASSHFLTFGVSMEPSDEFAFSGPKMTTVNVLPVQRRSVEYRLLPLDQKDEDDNGEKGEHQGWWIRPGLMVRDKYFQKVLRVLPGGEGLRRGEEGLEVWVPGARV